MRALRSIALVVAAGLFAAFSRDAVADDKPLPKLTAKPSAAASVSPSAVDPTLLKVSKTVLDRAKIHQLKPKQFENISPKEEQARLKGRTLVAAKKLKLGPKPKLDVGA